MSLFAVANHGSVSTCALYTYVEVYFSAVCLLCSALIDMGSAVLNRALLFCTHQKWPPFSSPPPPKHPFFPHHNVWCIYQMHPNIIKLASTRMPLRHCHYVTNTVLVGSIKCLSLHARILLDPFLSGLFLHASCTHFPHLCTQKC